MTGRLENETVLVTGAGGGIGAAIGEELLEAGARVVLHYNMSAESCEKLVERFGERAVALQADLSNDAGIDKLWSSTVDWAGRLTAIVNNAAIMAANLPEDAVEEWRDGWRRTLNVNLVAVADLCRNAILHFQEAGGGAIVNIASRAAFRGDLPDSMHYAASKGGVVALTRSIAKGYARQNILAYTVAPGWVLTERVRPRLEAPGNEQLVQEIPLGEPADPAEIAATVAFLLQGRAPSMTGCTIDVNGASYFH